MSISKSSALSISALLIFEMQEINGALFSKTRLLLCLSLASAPSIVMSPSTTIYASL